MNEKRKFIEDMTLKEIKNFKSSHKHLFLEGQPVVYDCNDGEWHTNSEIQEILRIKNILFGDK